MKTILITGGSGFVGSHLINEIPKKEFKIIGLYKQNEIREGKNINVDIRNREEVLSLKKFCPEIIIHCAALTDIGFCELNPKLAYEINVEGSKNIAELANKCNSKLIYISTDFVFDGKKGNYNEGDIPNPLTIYGKTKLEGEKICLKFSKNTIIIRTNLFGERIISKNKMTFVGSILNNLENKKFYPAFIDIKKTPLEIANFSDIINKLINKNITGVFHVGGETPISNYDFAVLVAEIFNCDSSLIKKASAEKILKNIKYPKDVTLNSNKISRILKYKIPSLKEMIINFKRKRDKIKKFN